MILMGAIFSCLLDFLRHIPILSMVAALFSAGYFGSYYLDIISSTMIHRDEVPEWPSFHNFSDDILSPFIRLLGLYLISFAPLIALYFLADHKASWFIPSIVAALFYGCIYFPMSALALLDFGGIGGALPHVVFPAVIRSLPGYLLPVLVLILGVVVCVEAQEYIARIPFVGWFLTALIALYGLMFQGRLIGLVYRDYRERIGWD